MPAPNFTWPAISNLQPDFFNQIKQWSRLPAGASGVLVVNPKHYGERHEH
jgi:hypothetical protein